MSARGWAALLAVGIASRVDAQSLAQRIDAVRDGTVQLTFASRPGVCGDGRGSISYVDDRGGTRERWNCVPGPVRVRLSRSRSETVTIRTCVACRPVRLEGGDVDLGEVPAADAAKYLLGIARHSGSRNAEEAVSAAAFADADVTPGLMELARSRDSELRVRKQAMFWLGQSRDPKAIQFFRDILVR